jgi:hypothetical protein
MSHQHPFFTATVLSISDDAKQRGEEFVNSAGSASMSGF